MRVDSSEEPPFKVCKVCLVNRPIKQFSRNHLCREGRETRCSFCKKEGKTQNRERKRDKETPKHLQTVDQIMRLTFVTKDDFKNMWDFLESIGYDVHNKEKSVHEQFVDKWNGLTGSKMTYRNKVRGTVSMYLADGSLNPEYTKYPQHKKKT
jgi:hypothetical protein